jgi:hypothetical protein
VEFISAVENQRFDVPFAPPNMLILLKKLGSNPTLSAMLFKMNELLKVNNPLSGSFFFSGMTDVQFCKAPVRSVKAKTDW